MPRSSEETIEVSVSLPESFALEIREQFPAGVSLSECVRNATEEAVRKRQEALTPDAITASVIRALERHDRE